MSLTDIPFKYVYRSNQDRLYKDFYEPCLMESISYDRAAGYFSSHSLQTLAKGLEIFLFQGGNIRIIASPVLSAEDIKAIESGYEAKSNVIERALLKEIEITTATIEKDRLNVLAWLIYKGQLEIKIAYTNNNALYHEKFGIFTDEDGKSVAFSGSANETLGGLESNFEKIDVYYRESDQDRIEGAIRDFDNLWNNTTNGLTIVDVPESIKSKILETRGSMPNRIKDETIEPRDYQQTAINKVKENNWLGILEMATGTGKTITSLFTAFEYKKLHNRLFLVIYAPFTHLVEQWAKECKKFNIDYITLCYGSKTKWMDELENEIRNYNIGIIDQHVVITTYKTAGSQHFQELIQKVNSNSFLIADECHYIGSRAFRKQKFDCFDAKVGLSATPDRWWDEYGTSFLKEVFDKVVYEYTLDEAIKNKKLTPYEYYPHVVSLTEAELADYEKITSQLTRLYFQKEKNSERIEVLNRRRALILARAESKIPKLISLLKEKKVEEITHTLVYCAEKQVDKITNLLSKLDLRVHKFDSTVPNKKRKEILDAFSDGTIQVLVAIKCLDEGVDVPSTRVAYFLASTSNPREFVQRRGRILRTAKNKSMAEIHDLIVFPEDVDSNTFTMIAKKELPRFAEFSGSAINRSGSKNQIIKYLDMYNLNHLMNKKPWDVYNEMKEEYDNDFFE